MYVYKQQNNKDRNVVRCVKRTVQLLFTGIQEPSG